MRGPGRLAEAPAPLSQAVRAADVDSLVPVVRAGAAVAALAVGGAFVVPGQHDVARPVRSVSAAAVAFASGRSRSAMPVAGGGPGPLGA